MSIFLHSFHVHFGNLAVPWTKWTLLHSLHPYIHQRGVIMATTSWICFLATLESRFLRGLLCTGHSLITYGFQASDERFKKLKMTSLCFRLASAGQL